MANATIQTSFAGGEMSPQLYARVDLAKYEVGAALLRNFIVDYRGGAANRPGTRFVADLTALGSTFALLPFIVSEAASYVLVLYDGGVDIYSSKIYVATVALPYVAADIASVKYTQSADVMTLVHPSYPPAELRRTSDTTFEYVVVAVGPEIQPPTITAMSAPGAGDYNYGYLVTTIGADGVEESLPSNVGVKQSAILNETDNKVISLEWTAPFNDDSTPMPLTRYNIYKWGPLHDSHPASSTWGFIGQSLTTNFVDNNIAPNFAQQPPVWGDPFSGGQFQAIAVDPADPGSGYTGGDWTTVPYIPLDITGDGEDAAGYMIYDPTGGEAVGVYLMNAGKNYTEATVTADGNGGSGATFLFTFSSPTPNYPSVAAYTSQRLAYAAPSALPQTIVMSQTGNFSNFNSTPGTLATDAITISLASQEVNAIRSLVSVSYGLLAFTAGESFLINGGSPYAALTPTSITAQVQSGVGANNLRPLVVNSDVLFGQAKGNRIRNFSYAWQKQTFTGADISTFAAHLFDNYLTVDWTWAEEPDKLVWLVRSDGRLLSCTYVPEQEVFAWARHDTQGAFKNVVSVPEGNANAVYVIVQRHLPDDDDQCWQYYLEVFESRGNCCINNAWFLDSAVDLLKYEGDFTIYITPHEDAGFVNVYSYDPCGSPGGNTFADTGVSVPAIEWDGNPINFVQPDDGIITAGTDQSRGVDNNLTQYTYDSNPGVGSARLCAVDVDGVTLWILDEDAVVDLFVTAGAVLPTSLTNVNVWPQGDKLVFTIEAVTSGSRNTYIGVAPTSTDVGVPVLTNYIRMRNPSVVVHTPFGFWELRNADGGVVCGLLATQDFSDSKIQFWFTPSIADVEAGTYKGVHPGCGGTLAADQGPTWLVSWTHASAFAMGEAGDLVHGGNVEENVTGFPISVNGEQRYYIVMPKGWMADNTSGMSQAWAATYPDGGAFYLDLTEYPLYPNKIWPTGLVFEVENLSTGAIDVTETDFLDSAGAATLPWPDEYTRILDEGANDGWLATYGARPDITYSGGIPSLYFNIIDGNETYEDTIGTGERVWYARVRGYKWNGSTFRATTPAEGIVFRNGDLSATNWNFDAPGTQNIEVIGSEIYFQIVQGVMGGTPNEGSILTQFGDIVPTVEAGNVILPLEVCGKLLTTEVVTESHLVAEVIGDISGLRIPNEEAVVYLPITEWDILTPSNTVAGLVHLEGKEVYALADGIVLGPFTVTDGAVTLDADDTFSSVVVGLSYVSQIKTLYLTDETLNRGTEQGKRKFIPAVTLRLDCTRGVEVGIDFDNLTSLPETSGATLFTGDARVIIFGDWETKGEVCIEQSQPLPAQVLGIIPEVVAGDTGN